MKSKIFLFALIAQLLSITASAYDAEIDGIYYEFSGTTASVVKGDNQYSGDVTIPESVSYNGNAYDVTSIGDFAFEGCRELSALVIPHSVTSIGQGAFLNCTLLTSILIPEGVIRIDYGALNGCSSLTSISIPKSVKYIGYTVFARCRNLTHIEVHEENPVYDSRNSCNAIIETSSNALIAGCMNTIIPDNVIKIEHRAFFGCSGLKSISFPPNMTSIEDGAFGYCDSLLSITIPMGINYIGGAAFAGCNSLNSILVNEHNLYYDSRESCNAIIRKSDNCMIAGCNKSVIPQSITSIGDEVFRDCKGLLSITIPDCVNSIGFAAFLGCSDLKSITIPSNTTQISDEVFRYCTSLTSIHFPDNITSIGSCAFEGCSSLSSVIIPESIMNIDDYAFNCCPSLAVVTVRKKSPIIITSNVFRGWDYYSNPTLYVPNGSKAAYQNADNWKDFKEIREYNVLTVDDLSIDVGGSQAIEIGLPNEDTNLVAFQIDLTLPEGISINKEGCSLSSRITDEKQELTIGKLGDNVYRLTSSSLSLTPIDGNEGTLLSLELNASEDSEGGQATLSNIRFSTSESERVIMSDVSFDINVLHKFKLTYFVDGEEYMTDSITYKTPLTPEAEPTKDGYTFGGWSEIPETMPANDVEITGRFYLYGDVNTDEEVDVVDVVDIARFVVATPSEKFREKLADLNSDETVNLGDAVTLVNFIVGDQNFVKPMFAPANYMESIDALRLTRNGKAISLDMPNSRDYTAFQFDLYLSEDADVAQIMLNTQRKQKHQLLYNKVEDGHYRVAAFSTTNRTFQNNEGELLSFDMDGKTGKEATISNIQFFDVKGNAYLFDAINGKSIIIRK